MAGTYCEKPCWLQIKTIYEATTEDIGRNIITCSDRAAPLNGSDFYECENPKYGHDDFPVFCLAALQFAAIADQPYCQFFDQKQCTSKAYSEILPLPEPGQD